jgi:hypothetical protein
MSGHTPGPWYVGAQNDGLYIIDRQPSPSNDDPRHDADVELVATPFAARGATVEANARLIAAAPETAAERDRLRVENAELLEALKDVMERLVDRHEADESAVKARAVIAKATGGEA